MKVCKFFEWMGYEDESFIDKYSTIIIKLEKEMKKEGLNIDIDNLYDTLEDLKVVDKWIDELDDFASDKYDKMYIKDKKFDNNLDDDVIEYTSEYYEIRKRVFQGYKNHLQANIKHFNRHLNDELLYNIAKKNWKEWKAIYQKWITYIEKHRGFLAGKKFNI